MAPAGSQRMTDPGLIVLLPVLDDVLEGRLACPPGLASLLDRGRVEPGGGDAALAAALGLSSLPAPGPRVAVAAGIGPKDGATWLRVDPVYLQPDLTAVWLRAPAVLDWSAPSMQPVLGELAALFASAGLEWHPPTPDRPGRLRLPEPPDADFPALPTAIGRRLDDVLPRGPEAARWHALINESQMLFHQFRSLDDPNPAGLGLWFWGPGTILPLPGRSPLARYATASGAPGDAGLASWLGQPAVPVDPGFAAGEGLGLVDASFGMDAAYHLPTLDAELLSPAWAALRSGRLKALRLIGRDRQLQAGRWTPFAFWRRRPAEVQA